MKLTVASATMIMLLALLFSTLFLAACSGSAAPAAAPQSDAKEAVFVPECPNGLVNDSYPGLCGKYVDQNADGICDLSQ
jgi:hypothetical protein